MASETEILNLALSHVGVSKEVANIDTENSASASAGRRFFKPARDETFRDFNWPFATEFGTLGLVETAPNTDWGYSYRYPSDCMRARKLLTGVRNSTREGRASYKIASDASGKLIFTDEANAVLEYTRLVTDVGLFPQDYIMMLSLLLASYIAPRVTAGDPFKLGERAFKFYIDSKTKAEATALNEQQDDRGADSEFITSRL